MIVGVLGGGQLARMLALAGYPLGVEFIFLDPAADACTAPLGEHLHGPYADRDLLTRLAERADVVTYEFENVSLDSVRFLAERVPVFPSAAALAAGQERLREKQLFRDLGIPTTTFAPADTLTEFEQAVAHTGLPAIAKTLTLGYDGKGQALLRDSDDLAKAWHHLGGTPVVVERFVPFDREASIIAVRARTRETAFYPLVENTHRDGILRLSISRPGDPMQARAEDYSRRLLDALDYVGVLALELFQAGDELLANEFAPRVHNSGHWTIEGAETSQFENHLRAILGWPLGDTAAVGFAAMINCVGTMPDLAQVAALPGAHVHLYGKEPRAGRKLGHITLRRPDEPSLREALELAGQCLSLPGLALPERERLLDPHGTPHEQSPPARLAIARTRQ